MTKTQRKTTTPGRIAKLPHARRRALRQGGSQVCLGTLVGWDDEGALVDFDGNVDGPRRARASRGVVVRPADSFKGEEVVLLVDPRPGQPPILLGTLRPLGGDAAPSDVEARIDGRRVELEGADEIVLRCGAASITLRRNGRVLIKGVQVETRASGVNRIKGGSVAIN